MLKTAAPSGATNDGVFRALIPGTGGSGSDRGGGIQATIAGMTLPVTVAFWVKTVNADVTTAGGNSLWGSNTDAERIVQFPSGQYNAQSGAGAWVTAGSNISDTWLHIRYTFNTDGTITRQLNGVTNTGSSTSATEITSSGTHWVAQGAGADTDMVGKLFDVICIEGAYTAAQLNYLNSTTWQDFTWPTSTAGYRLAGQNTSTPGIDLSPNGNDFSLSTGASSDLTASAADLPGGVT